MPSAPSLPRVVGWSANRLAELAVSLGEPAYRGKQLFRWIHAGRACTFQEMTNLPVSLRTALPAQASLELPAVAEVRRSADGSCKYALALADGALVEAVYIPRKDRVTLCLSSQVGCRFGCTFCATATMGLQRHLEASEIIAQVMAVCAAHGMEHGSPFNVVFMGMGEPLDNRDAVLEAFDILTDPDGFGLSWRRITLSTVGVLPGIEYLAQRHRRPRLAVSLSATEDEARNRLVPANRRWPLADLQQALASFPVRSGESITFEYVLLAGENDTEQDADRLAALVRNLPVRINIIPWNPHGDLPHARPEVQRAEGFRDALRRRGVEVTIRFSRGGDIGAACGQLVTSSATVPAVRSTPA